MRLLPPHTRLLTTTVFATKNSSSFHHRQLRRRRRQRQPYHHLHHSPDCRITQHARRVPVTFVFSFVVRRHHQPPGLLRCSLWAKEKKTRLSFGYPQLLFSLVLDLALLEKINVFTCFFFASLTPYLNINFCSYALTNTAAAAFVDTRRLLGSSSNLAAGRCLNCGTQVTLLFRGLVSACMLF